MRLDEGDGALESLLAPLSPDEFLGQTVAGGFRWLPGRGADLPDLLGADPRASLADAVHLAPRLTWHSANALGPAPSLANVADGSDFRARIEAFHAANYSVRFPELRPLSPPIDRVARALEARLHQPVTASAFWSRGGMRAPVHYDDHDLIVVQLFGEKRWYVSTAVSPLFNAWKGVDGNPPQLGEHEVIEMRPGDRLYLPRGTAHTVDSDHESVHLAFGFTPLTVREAVIAAIDHLSDLDRDLRATLSDRRLAAVGPRALAAASRLLEAVRSPEFLFSALQRRSARVVGDLDALPRADAAPSLDLDSEVVRAPGAFAHLTGNAETIDFAYPGGHLYIHRGAEAAVAFVAERARFRPRDIPGDVDDQVRLALVSRLLDVGYLVAASPTISRTRSRSAGLSTSTEASP
ncbi:MAG: hypothetical protein GC203_02490 [Phenylobacterium sp.]|uniref:JmjC domain-containing protein n=1 Tax=Phenylobacterium sp. TaxID=1871053 RepID=UPI0025ECD5A5|nr:cupin domain-containing protein [Phenylobacterium sp.]MBI1196711.1 hypothetical protein [Phenylobacterium sp.]